MKKLFVISIILGLAYGAANAGTRPLKGISTHKIHHHPPKCFYAGETSFDIISIYVDPRLDKRDHDDHHGDSSDGLEDGFGGGISLSHFFTENFGLMGRAYWWDTSSIVNSVTASAIIRYPLQELCLAPYVFGGIGGHFDSDNQASGHLGAGLEYRFTDRVGLVGDYSYTWTDKTEDWHLYTLGLRIKF